MPLTYIDHLKIIGTNWGLAFLAAGLAVALLGVWWLAGELKRSPKQRSRERIIGAVLLIIGGIGWSYLQSLIPTRYASNPTYTAYTVAEATALARPLYDEHCAVCHGATGKGDGPIAEFLLPPPADFSIHGWHHREGEHYWWITRGIHPTAMPSFEGVLSEEQRWLLARFVKQIGREARLP